MNAFETVPVLNRLLNVLCRSLPAYLADVSSAEWSDGEKVRPVLERLVADQRMYADRVAEAIAQYGGQLNPGRFPTGFTAKNDLSLTFLLKEIINGQTQAVTAIEECVGQLEGESALHALAEEILGNTKGHLDILNALTRE